MLILAAMAVAVAEVYSIPADKVDQQKVYWGVADKFQKPGEVNYEAIIKETPEFREVKAKRIERGSGKYWILMSQASDRTVRAIVDVSKKNGYDLIAAQGYLGSLETAIPAEDVTPLVVKAVKPAPARKSILG